MKLQTLSKIGMTAAALAVVGVVTLTLFGDHLRRVTGSSADSLGGSAHAPPATRSTRSLKHFGSRGAYDAPPVPRPSAEVAVLDDRLSTFGMDVDTAAYTYARRHLREGVLPRPEDVRLEELVNYFSYDYPAPEDGRFAVHLDGVPSPFSPGKHLLRVGVKAREVSNADRKPAHLVFLVDTSGSMAGEDRLLLAQQALRILVDNLNARDTVALVTYAGAVRDVLPPTPASDRARIVAAIDSLRSGGGTAMGSGMELAYRHAVREVSPGTVSRVIVLSDGDANIGPNRDSQSILAAIRGYVEEGVTLSTVGFGMGNHRASMMEQLANQGNGNAYYVDSLAEARRIFELQLAGTLEVVAKDAKIQVEWDPEAVKRYRLLGYENRDLADQDFRDDRVDSGDVGAGQSVTALYEVELAEGAASLGTVRIRSKEASGREAAEESFAFTRATLAASLDGASSDLRFAIAVAAGAELLRQNPLAEGWSMHTAVGLARENAQGRPDREEFVSLMERAAVLLDAERPVVAEVESTY